MTKKTDQVLELLAKVELPSGVPEPPKEGSLLERGMILALLAHMSPQRAEAVVATLKKAYVDWNEARVAQAQELAQHLAGKSGKAGERGAKLVPAANAIKAYLQEVFQRTHGLDLEFLRGDAAAAAKVVTAMPMLGNYLGSVLLYLADAEQPVTASTVRVLDRLGLLSRTSSVKKAREAMGPLIPPDQALRFAAGFGYVADRWCDARKPTCWECVLVESCPTGKKVFRDWKVQQERLALQRAREETKRVALEAKEAARRERDAERQRKRDAAALLKAEREAKRAQARSEKAAQAQKAKQRTTPTAAETSGGAKGAKQKAPGGAHKQSSAKDRPSARPKARSKESKEPKDAKEKAPTPKAKGSGKAAGKSPGAKPAASARSARPSGGKPAAKASRGK